MSNNCRKHTVVLGITGSVATVKVPELCVKLSSFADIRIVATERSLHFLKIAEEYNPEIFKQYSYLNIPVLTDSDEWDHYKSVKNDPVLHVNLRKECDVLAIIPLTANTMAKMTNGICDNILLSTYRAWGSKKPVIVAPCMNTEMYNHPITEQQLQTLKGWGVHIIEPVEKLLACGDMGKGALPSVDDVVEMIRVLL